MRLTNPRITTPADLAAMRDRLIAAMAKGQTRISTPQLGEIEYRGVGELQKAIAWIDGEIQRLNPQQRSFVAQSNRGTGGCE